MNWKRTLALMFLAYLAGGLVAAHGYESGDLTPEYVKDGEVEVLD